MDPQQIQAMVTRLAELEARDGQWTQQNQGLQNQLMAANQVNQQQQLVNAAAVAQPPRGPSTPKIPMPKQYDGESGTCLNDWFVQVRRQFIHCPQHFTTEASKIEYAVNYTSSRVQLAFEDMVKEYATLVDEHGQPTPLVTWVQFEKAFHDRYQPIASEKMARNRIDTLRQTGGVAAYTTLFQQSKVYISSMADAEAIHRYTSGLKDDLKIEVAKASPTSLNDAINIAGHMESILHPSKMSLSSP